MRVKVVREEEGNEVLMLALEEVGWSLQNYNGKKFPVPHKTMLVSFYLNIFSFLFQKKESFFYFIRVRCIAIYVLFSIFAISYTCITK